VEEPTVKAGLLLEAIEAQRAGTEAALERLQQHTAGLDVLVRDEIRATLIEELRALSDEGERVAQQLRALATAARLRFTLWGLAAAALSGVIPLGVALWVLPSRAEVARLSATRDTLAADLARLEAHGARAQLRRCGASLRLCVRVERSTPAYGEGADFLVVKGY
jgi:hypothetical protein